MTLKQFEERLKKINPKFSVRKRGTSDVAGVFIGSEYICRLTQGEFNLNGYRYKLLKPGTIEYINSNIQKRGRKTTVKLLTKYFKNKIKDRAYLLWGVGD